MLYCTREDTKWTFQCFTILFKQNDDKTLYTFATKTKATCKRIFVRIVKINNNFSHKRFIFFWVPQILEYFVWGLAKAITVPDSIYIKIRFQSDLHVINDWYYPWPMWRVITNFHCCLFTRLFLIRLCTSLIAGCVFQKSVLVTIDLYDWNHSSAYILKQLKTQT